ncbi:MAG: Gfo/Idh/MocA family oxidoreductase [Chloroflexi bacterium]|nr:Gfo/Idh/MocA family oxidoreductase [Chloroflexota bacterium]
MKRLRVAVVGAGNIAQQHLPVLTQHPLCEVAVLCDVNAAVLAATADRFGIAERITSPEALLRRDDLDAAFVLVSHRATVAVASAFIAAGIPTLLEKPPGIYSSQTAALAELQAHNGTIAMVGLNRRFYASHLAAREWLRAHGPLATLTVEAHEDLTRMTTSRFTPDELPVMMRRRAHSNGIHALDLVRYFGGEVAEVHAERAAFEHDFADSFTATLRFAGGAVGRVIMDFFAPGSHRFECRTVGARLTSDTSFGGVTLTVRGQPAVRFEPDEEDRRFKAGFWKQDSVFLEAVRAGRQPASPAASLADAYETMRLIDRICGDGD